MGRAPATRARWLAALWAGCFLGGLLAFFGLAPEGSGFTRGLNRLVALLGWHAAAVLPALGLLAVARGLRAPWRQLRWLPALLAVLEFGGLAGLIVAARLDAPNGPGALPAEAPPRPVKPAPGAEMPTR